MNDTTLYRLRAGELLLDESRREVSLGGLRLEISAKPFDLLALLMRAEGAVVPRDLLLQAVWHGRPTVDNVLAVTVGRLRAVLGEAHADWIEVLPRVGYRFKPKVQRTVVAQRETVQLDLRAGGVVPGQDSWRLERLLTEGTGRQVWLARRSDTTAARVYKFATSEQGRRDLGREAGISRLLASHLGDRADLCPVVDWRLNDEGAFIALPYCGVDLELWMTEPSRRIPDSLPQRLEIFISVARAVGAAHAIGVLHKDIKPANILIEPEAKPDGQWDVRITDFGCGQVTQPERLRDLALSTFGLTDSASLAAEGGWASYKYLAPELLQDEPASAASDIYALGVLLFQLTIGDLARPLTADWHHQVADPFLREDIALATTAAPGERIASAIELADRVAQIDARRIVAAAAEAEAGQAAAENAARERARRRAPWVLALAALGSTTAVVTTVLYFQLLGARDALSQQLAQTKALNRFLVDDFVTLANPEISGHADFPVAAAARVAAERIDERFATADPATRIQLHRAMATAFAGMDDYTDAVKETDAAARNLGSPAVNNALRTLIPLERASYLEAQGKNDEARTSLQQALAEDPGLPDRPGRAGALYWLTTGRISQAQLAAVRALTELRKAAALAETAPDITPAERDVTRFILADALRTHNETEEAIRRFGDILQERSTRLGADHPTTCYTLVPMARAEGDLGQPAKGLALIGRAEICLSERLGPTQRRVLAAAQVHADLLMQSDQFADAARRYDQVAESMARVPGMPPIRIFNTQGNAARCWHYAGQLSIAMERYRKLVTSAAASLGELHPTVQNTRFHYVDTALDAGQTRGLREVLATLSLEALQNSEPEPDWDGRLAFEQGRIEALEGHTKLAMAQFEHARQVIKARNPGARINEARILREEAALAAEPARSR